MDTPRTKAHVPDDSLPPSSLIICSRNRPTILAETIASVLEGQDVPTELVIIDQSDRPNSELAELTSERPCEIRYRSSRSVGLSRARNEGIEQARYPIFAFTDDDVLVTRSWFGRLIRTLIAEGTHTVVTGQVLPAESAEGGFVPSTKVDPIPAVFQGRIGADVIYPHNMAMYASLMKRVGEFDERLGAGSRYAGAEDNDFCFRLLEAGFRIVYAPDVVIYHRAWRSQREYVPLKWHYGRGQGAYYGKHIGLHDRYMLWRLTSDVRFRLWRGVRRIPSEPRHGLGDLAYAFGTISGVVQWLVTERKR